MDKQHKILSTGGVSVAFISRLSCTFEGPYQWFYVVKYQMRNLHGLQPFPKAYHRPFKADVGFHLFPAIDNKSQ